jgi:Flp pilus assembly protein TadD
MFHRFSIIGLAALAAISIGIRPITANAEPSSPPETRANATDIKKIVQIARASAYAGNIAGAIELYRGVVARGAGPAIRVEYADTLRQGGMIDDAIGVYESVDSRSPASLQAILGLERCYARLGEPLRALDYARKAVAQAPADERVQVTLGIALDAVGRHQEAQTYYRRALSSAPRSVAARNDLALSLAFTGQFPEAIDLLTPMVKSANATPQVRQNLALIYGLKGDHDQALALGKADLDATAAQANLRYFELARAHAP